MKRFEFLSFCPIILLLFVFFTNEISAQQFRTPRPSPNASVAQTVGITEVTINYSRPGVKNRTIWGALVPYDKVWRTGANGTTTIVISDPVKINGGDLPAGTYGIYTMPTESEWSVMFCKNISPGSETPYKEENVALKIKVKPEPSEFNERMIFTFTDVTDNSAKVILAWEKIKVPFTITTATQDMIISNVDNGLWNPPMQAAVYCLQNNIQTEKALNLINASVLINENYWNMRIKAQLLAKAGKKQEAVTVMEKAIDYGKKMDDKPFDLDAMNKMLSDWKS